MDWFITRAVTLLILDGAVTGRAVTLPGPGSWRDGPGPAVPQTASLGVADPHPLVPPPPPR